MAGYKSYLSNKASIKDGFIFLDEKESHHLIRVLRLKVGQLVKVSDGLGKLYETKVFNQNAKKLTLDIISINHSEQRKNKITLIFAITKTKSMELVLKIATEIGISAIQPVITDHSVFKVDSKLFDRKEKWEKIIIEAGKQCGSAFLPDIKSPCKIEEYFQEIDINSKNRILASLRENKKTLIEYLNSLENYKNEFILAIGPEGDFSKKEYKMFQDFGFHGVKLSNNILRSETAVLYSLSVLDQFLR